MSHARPCLVRQHKRHEQPVPETCPRLHIFAGCENLFKHLGNLSHAVKGDPEDAGGNPHDHLPDALRYLLINLGGGPSWPDVTPDVKALHARHLAM